MLRPCVSCKALVPDMDSAPYPRHKPDCNLVAGWMRERELLQGRYAQLIQAAKAVLEAIELQSDTTIWNRGDWLREAIKEAEDA